MGLTIIMSKVVGPVLLLRAASILIDRQQFTEMLKNLEQESRTISFSMFPIAVLMTAIAIATIHTDTSSLAAIIFHLIAWMMIAQTSLLIVVPSLVAQNVRFLGRIGFVNFVCALCSVIGAYLTWFGFFS